MIIPYLKIGEKYFTKDGLQSSLDITSDNQYVTINYDLSHFSANEIKYLSCYTYGKPLKTFISSYIRANILENLQNRIIPQFKAISQLKVSSDLYPNFIDSRLFEDYHQELLDAIIYAFGAIPEPSDYPHLRYALGVAERISKMPLRYSGEYHKIHYNPFPENGLGRYGLKKGSFNILSCPKSQREKIEPYSEEFIFYEYDFNAFEIRTLLAYCLIKQPEKDLYQILADKQNMTRSEFKQKLLISIYSDKIEETYLHNIVKKQKLRERFPIVDDHIINVFGKKLKTDQYHYFSRLLQSTSAYILFEQLYKLMVFLEEHKLKTTVAFCIHDSVCLNVHKSETDYIPQFEEVLSTIDIPKLNYKDKFMMKIKKGTLYSKMELI